MKNYIKIVFFIILTSCINFYAAQQATETPTAQATQLSVADQAKIKEYRNAYELFKQAVLTNKLGEAEEYLKRLQNQFSTLSQSIRDELFMTMYDDTITHLVGEHPSEEQFFTLAKKYIEDIKTGKDTLLAQNSVQKSQPPTPPAFLTPQQKPAPRQYTEDEKRRFAQQIYDTGFVDAKILIRAIEDANTPLALYLIDTRPDLIKKPGREGLLPLQVAIKKGNKAIAEHIIEQMPATVTMQQQPQSPFYSKDFPIHTAIRHYSIPMMKLLLANGADINTKDGDGNTPLMAAIRIFPQAIDNIAFLINNDADLNIKNYCDNLNLIQIVLLRIYGSTDYQKEISTEILNLILESSQLQSNPALKERLVNEPNPQGLPLCQTAAAKWTEGARLLIKHGADCTNGRYKDFLVPLIKEVEAERAKTTFDVLHGETLQEQKLLKPVANIVREYIEGEKTGAAQPAASKPSTTPATEVD